MSDFCDPQFVSKNFRRQKKKKKKKRKKIATKNKRDSNYVRVHFPTFSHATNYDATLPIQLDV